MSHTGHVLSRATSFRFALDVTPAQHELLIRYAGARRAVWNQHVARIRRNLWLRDEQRAAGVPEEHVTPAESWTPVSFINYINVYKKGDHPDCAPNDDGTLGWSGWQADVSADVFECASVDAARAFLAFSQSKKGQRPGPRVGFPRFAKKDKSTPTFRLRSRSKPGDTAPVRFESNRHLRVPRVGTLKIHGSGKRMRRMVDAGRFHAHSVTFTFRHGRWWASIQGVAAPLHHLQRSAKTRSTTPVGVDLGVKTLAVVADTQGNIVEEVHGPKSLAAAQDRMRTLNRRLARTTPGSRQHATVTRQLNRLHRRAAAIRRHQAHEFTTRLVSNHQSITVEDLHVAGMARLRTLGRAVADAGMGNLLHTLAYKADWYGVDLHVADRWYPSSKTCSSCGHVKDELMLSERVYRCDACGLVLDRDVNAAVNLARWPAIPEELPPHRVAA